MKTQLKLIKALSLGALMLSAVGCNDNSNNDSSSSDNNSTVELLPGYNVKVVDKEGNAYKDIQVQVCSATTNTCLKTRKTGEDGIANINEKDDQYYVHLLSLPEGYTYNPNIYTLTETVKYIEVVLENLSSFTGGNGSKENVYTISNEGYYNASFAAKEVKYFSFTPSVPGTYEIESYAVDKLPLVYCNPEFAYFGNDAASIANPVAESHDDGVGKNFLYNLVVTEEDFADQVCKYSYIFGITLTANSDNDFPIDLTFSIKKAN